MSAPGRARSRSPRGRAGSSGAAEEIPNPLGLRPFTPFQPAQSRAPAAAAAPSPAGEDVDELDAFMNSVTEEVKKTEKKDKKKRKKEGLSTDDAARATPQAAIEMFRSRLSTENGGKDVDGLDESGRLVGGTAEWKF